MFGAFIKLIVRNLGAIPFVLLGASIFCTLLGGARFSNRSLPSHVLLHSDDIKTEIYGKFELIPIAHYNRKGEPISSLEGYHGFNLASLLTDKEMKYDSSSQYIFSLQRIERNLIAFTVFQDGKEKDYIEFKGEFKRSGFFHLDEEVRSCIGFPYLLGGCYHYKARIGLTEDGNLIYNSTIAENGALLVVLWKGYRNHKTYEFRRIRNVIRP